MRLSPRIVALGVSAAVFMTGCGAEGEKIDEQATAQRAIDTGKVIEKLKGLSDRNLYEAYYLNGYGFWATEGVTDSKDLRSDGNFSGRYIRLGQTCLKELAFNTLGTEKTPPATFVPGEGSTLLVKPYGSTDDALRFTRDGAALIPDEKTKHTLISNSCLAQDGLPVFASKNFYSVTVQQLAPVPWGELKK